MTSPNTQSPAPAASETVVLPGGSSTTAAGQSQPAASSSYPGYVPAPSASLYVGELLPEVNEAMLFDLFSQVGPVASIRICRDAITRRSLGYAYVNFHSVQDCERALDTLNYVPIKGHPCRIMWSQRDPSLRRSGTGNIFIKNLDPSIDNKALHDTFSAFGNILSCKVALDDKGASRGYGFVHFETQEAADLAIEKVNGMLLNDRQVYVGRHISRKERLQALESLRSNFTNIYVKNLDEDCADEHLKELFGKFGEITSAVVQRDTDNKSRGFGFVNFAGHEAAQRAVEEVNNREFRGRTVYVGRAQKRTERDEELRRQFETFKLERMSKFTGVNLYVKNLSETIDDERLRQEFTPFGMITSCKVMTDDKGNSRGFGFVCYGSPEESQRALTEMNGRMLNGKPLYVSMAQRKEERRAQLEAQYSARAAQVRMQQQAATGMSIFQQGPLFYGAPPGVAPGAPGRYHSGIPGPAGSYVPRGPGSMAPMPPGAMAPAMRAGGMRYNRGPNAPGGFRPPMQSASGSPAGGIAAGMPAGQPGMPRRPPYVGQGRAPYPGGYRRQMAPMPGAPGYGQPDVLTAAALTEASPEQRKRLIGERLYPLVQARINLFSEASPVPQVEQLPGKVTGMLLELDNSDLLGLLESPEALTDKVHEALEVLKAAASN